MHSSIASQSPVKLGVFHQRKIRKAPDFNEGFAPTKNSMVAQGKAEDLNAQIT